MILTSNRTREIHDALKRRCLYHWIDFPTYDKEFRILQATVPEAPESLARPDLSASRRASRRRSLQAAGDGRDARLGAGTAGPRHDRSQRPEPSTTTLGVILKYQEDVDSVRGDVAANLVGRALLRI